MKTARSRVESIPGPDDTIRIRLPKWQRVLIPLAAIFYAFLAVSELTLRPLAGFGVLGAVLGILALYVARMLFWGIDLTPQVAVVHAWRRRVIPWADVDGVLAEEVGNLRFVTFNRVGGKRIEIPGQALRGFSSSRRTDARFHVIAQYWATHYGRGQVYYNLDIIPYQEAYLTADLAENLRTAPDTRRVNTAWILCQVGLFGVIFPPLIICSIVALVFAVPARRRLRDHGAAYPLKLSSAFRASVFALALFTAVWGLIVTLLLT